MEGGEIKELNPLSLIKKNKKIGIAYFTSIDTQALQRCWKTGALRPVLLAGQAGP